MKNRFNTASLASLSKPELLSLLATYEARMNASPDEMDRSILRYQISEIELALGLK